MSIFNQSIDNKLINNFKNKQNILSKDIRTNIESSYLLYNPVWVRLSSSVVVNDYPSLAKNNVLESLYQNEEYEFKNSIGISLQTGFKPKPGITNITISNIGAYGSIRKVNIEYKCFDIEQLNILEKLYMRPGYTVLLEVGKSYYLDNNQLKDVIPEDFFNKNDINITEYCNYLYNKSLQYNGDYDALFGYIINFDFTLNSDGTYSCSTEIISTGELIESIKINYPLAGLTSFTKDKSFKGLILPKQLNENEILSLCNISRLNEEYSKNALSGLIYELYCLGKSSKPEFSSIDYSSNFKNKLHEGSNKNIYILLEDFLKYINEYVIPHSISNGDQKLGSLVTITSKNIDGNSNKCLFHPLMTSVDPDVCWLPTMDFSNTLSNLKVNQSLTPLELYPNDDNRINSSLDSSIRSSIIKWIKELIAAKKSIFTFNSSAISSIKEQIETLININSAKYSRKDMIKKIVLNYQIVRGGKINNIRSWKYFLTYGGTIDEVYFLREKEKLRDNTLGYLFNINNDTSGLLYELSDYQLLDSNIETYLQNQLNVVDTFAKDQASSNKVDETVKNDLTKLALNDEYTLQPFRENNQNYGNIGSIYVNLKYLYSLSQEPRLYSQDLSGLNTISLISFVKELMKNIQTSIGNINDFEIHIGNDNIGRIIDLNYTNRNLENTLYIFDLNGRKSIGRNVKLKSHISSEMSSMIAISAQSEPGKLGLENSTLVSFNKGITDKMIPKKDSPSYYESNRYDVKQQALNFISSLSYIFNNYYKSFINNKVYNQEESLKYKESLQNLIYFLTNYYKSENKNKTLLPFRLTFDIDGIGGLIIGSLFNVDSSVIPDSYKISGKTLTFIVIRTSSTISGNEWITSIEAVPFLIDTADDGISEIPKNLTVEYNSNTGQINTFIDGSPSKALSLGFLSDSAKSNLRYMISFYKKQGFTDTQIAGIIGNAIAESSLNPTKLNPNDKGMKSYGLFQWRGSRLDNLMKYPKYNTLETQLVFSTLESNYKSLKNRLLEAKTIEDSTFIWARYYEVCEICLNKDSVIASNRLGYAKSVLNEFL